jgi:hypothetical protein
MSVFNPFQNLVPPPPPRPYVGGAKVKVVSIPAPKASPQPTNQEVLNAILPLYSLFAEISKNQQILENMLSGIVKQEDYTANSVNSNFRNLLAGLPVMLMNIANYIRGPAK